MSPDILLTCKSGRIFGAEFLDLKATAAEAQFELACPDKYTGGSGAILSQPSGNRGRALDSV